MKQKRRTKLGSRSTEGAASEGSRLQTSAVVQPDDAWGMSPRMFALLSCLAGLLIGAITSLSVVGAFQPHSVSDKLARKNSLLIAQQLDELFQKMDQRIMHDQSSLDSYLELLQVFCLYDRQFVAQNMEDGNASVETAYASARLGQCAQFFGNLEQSKIHFRDARSSYLRVAAKSPMDKSVECELLDAQTTIAALESATGNLGVSREEFYRALSLAERILATRSIDPSDDSLTPIQSLATLGMKLGLYDDALQLAMQIVDAANRLSAAYPQDSGMQQQATEAQRFLEELARSRTSQAT